MANTTNFGWETPDDTDLVKDGAAAMRTLGNAIDASLVDLKGGTTNQILAKNSNTDMDFKWVANDVGDITAVTAGTGLSGGGTSGDVTLTNTVATTFDAKGDLVVGTGADTFAKLVAGSNGDTVVADSSTTTGLRWSPDFASGRNKIINGDFGVNQRNFSSTTANATFIFDRWQTVVAGGTSTISSQTFTPGTAPVAGYEGKNFLRLVSSGQSGASDRTSVSQYIEDSRTLAGQTATISFWAKASTGTPSVAVEFWRSYGTGGSPSAAEFLVSAKTAITSSWARYSMTVSIPSLSGKTLGTTDQGFLAVVLFTSAGSNLNANTQSLGIQSATIDFWGVQVESGSVATPFTTATGTLAGELAACQRYFISYGGGSAQNFATGQAYSGTQAWQFNIPFPVTMRTTPSVTISSAAHFRVSNSTAGNITTDTVTSTAGDLSPTTGALRATVASGLTAGNATALYAQSADARIQFGAEL